MRSDDIYLEHILLALKKVKRHVNGLKKGEFKRDEKTVGTVLFQIVIIGEAANNLSDQFQEKYCEIPWAKIVGMRNRLVHGYAEIDIDLVWDACQIDLPLLEKQIKEIVK